MAFSCPPDLQESRALDSDRLLGTTSTLLLPPLPYTPYSRVESFKQLPRRQALAKQFLLECYWLAVAFPSGGGSATGESREEGEFRGGDGEGPTDR